MQAQIGAMLHAAVDMVRGRHNDYKESATYLRADPITTQDLKGLAGGKIDPKPKDLAAAMAKDNLPLRMDGREAGGGRALLVEGHAKRRAMEG